MKHLVMIRWGGVFCLLALLLSSCSKELFDHTEASDPKQFTGPISQWPELQRHVTQQQQKAKLRRDSDLDYWSLIDLNKVIVNEDKDGLLSYTFYVNLPPDPMELIPKLTNLVVKEKVDGDYEVYVVEYLSSDLEQWLRDYQDKIVSSISPEIKWSLTDKTQEICGTNILRWHCPCEGEHTIDEIEGCFCSNQPWVFEVVFVRVPCHKSMDLNDGQGAGGGTFDSGGSLGSNPVPGGVSGPSGSNGSNSNGSADSDSASTHSGTGAQDASAVITMPNEGSNDNSEDCQQLNNLKKSAPDHTEPDILLQIEWIKNQFNNGQADNKEFGVSMKRTTILGQDNQFTYNNLQITNGGATSVDIDNECPTCYGGIHNHPKNGHGMFSYGDVKWLRNCYYNILDRHKPAAVSLLVIKDYATGNFKIYAMRVSDYAALDSKVEQVWNDAKYANITDDKERMDKILRAQAKIYNKSNGDFEKSFLEQFQNAGIKLFKASNDQLDQWSELELKNGQVVPKPC